MSQLKLKEEKPSRWRKMMKPWRFEPPELERLYSSYTASQKQPAVERLLVTAMIFDIYAFLVPGEPNPIAAFAIAITALLLNFVLGIATTRCEYGSRAHAILAHVVWLSTWAQVLISAARRTGDAYNEHLGWALLLQYLTFAVMPFNSWVLLGYSIASALLYLLAQYYSYDFHYAENPFFHVPAEAFFFQQAVNFSLLAAATMLGTVSYVVSERQQRLAFRETKKSLEVKLLIEEQSKEQERLLLSVLPEHVAVEMRRDLDLIDTQFKKIYMSRHENVSILYADIVGFTAISSTYSAQDLVAILNELFARFDRLAEKYHQLRIKILGDCYYCISGAPVERPDHAVLCVHMGLSMVKAIKYVQKTTNSPVDMRVGIHTGAVLAGVLGQRQWQFDVYSRDVELANKMESSGMAGRVHISEKTLSYLQDEFEVEPAHGERREEALRQAGIKTYFIVRVLKPFDEGGWDKSAGDDLMDMELEEEMAGTPSDLKDDDEESILSPQEENKVNEEEQILHMLDYELVHRDDDKVLEGQTTFCLTFTSPELEHGYVRRAHFGNLILSVPLLLSLVCLLFISDLASPPSFLKNAVFASITAFTGLVDIGFYGYYRYCAYKNKTLCHLWELSCALFNIVMVATANTAALSICAILEDANAMEATMAPAECCYPSFHFHMSVMTLLSTIHASPIGVMRRVILLMSLALLQATPALYSESILRQHFLYQHMKGNSSDLFDNDRNFFSCLFGARLLLMLFLIVGALAIFVRYNEAQSRARHIRAVRMKEQREQAADLRRRNQALVYNVLPPHVAQHFMGARRRHHRDLYSQSYAEVSVLFASMPNFSEFYSEESVNNQGLECLRFLNEVISDFDALLEKPAYKDIIKIKTIGSTYMAASGLNPSRTVQPDDSITVRWAHLACLVEFALELKRALQSINEQSFNHFVLKMGVNHGPITAGVIGARKPHYDIWGNTVNVASRMESTGKAGCIQVTEETCHILQNFGYYFEQRGLVAVKGKGQLMTYYLLGKGVDPNLAANQTNMMETVMEEEGVGVNDVDAKVDCQSPLLSNGNGTAAVKPSKNPGETPADSLLPVDTF